FEQRRARAPLGSWERRLTDRRGRLSRAAQARPACEAWPRRTSRELHPSSDEDRCATSTAGIGAAAHESDAPSANAQEASSRSSRPLSRHLESPSLAAERSVEAASRLDRIDLRWRSFGS